MFIRPLVFAPRIVPVVGKKGSDAVQTMPPEQSRSRARGFNKVGGDRVVRMPVSDPSPGSTQTLPCVVWALLVLPRIGQSREEEASVA
jgi:hypothetical protein